MNDILNTKRETLRIIHDKLIPWTHSGGGHNCVLAKLPLHVPPNVHIKSRPAPALLKADRGNSYFILKHWEEAHLETLRFPYLGYVVEGEADLIVGEPTLPRKRLNSDKKGNTTKTSQDAPEQMVLTVSEGTFIIYPPGVLHEDGGLPHWLRPHPELARAKIFWMNVLPSGVTCHTCTTIKGQHNVQQHLFLHDLHFLSLTNFLLRELAERGERYELAAQSYLLALLVRLERGIKSGTVLTINEVPRLHDADDELHLDTHNTIAIERACKFIQSHLHEPLTPSIIAHHAYISAPHLMRLFRLKKSTTVMKYVEIFRIEHAKLLLQDTDLPIGEVGQLVGYPDKPHFSHAFSKATGKSPLKYRRAKAVTRI